VTQWFEWIGMKMKLKYISKHIGKTMQCCISEVSEKVNVFMGKL